MCNNLLVCIFLFQEITKRFENCSDAVGSNTIDKEEKIDTNDFFNQMFTAQFGIWISFTVWFTLLTFSMVKLCRYHHEENLRVSMAKERKRLINEDLVSEVPPGKIIRWAKNSDAIGAD